MHTPDSGGLPHPALHQRVRVEVPTETTWSGPVAGNVARSFDDDFRVETESVNGGHTVTYEYDPDSLVTRVDQASGPELDLQRNAGAGFGAGLLTGTTQGVIATTETPSPFGELESLVATENSNPLYTLDVGARDALGRIETKIETLGAGSPVSTVYTYDAAGRLDTVTVDSTLTADYAYDANGNRTHEREDLLGPPIAVYDDQDRLLSYDGTTYTYSAAGDLETSTHATGTTTYGYDALGNLRSVVLPDAEQIEYGIDGQNRRVGKKVCPAPCTPPATPQPVQGFLYGDQLRIVAELDASNDVVSRFVYATRPNVPDFLVKDGTTYRILSDQVGSVRLVVNASTGSVAQRIDYDAFGVVTQDTNPGFQPFGFAGGLMDPDTGLVRFGVRDYDPRVGRWTSKDPIGFRAGDSNLYAYVVGDPVNAVDPTGLILGTLARPVYRMLGQTAAEAAFGGRALDAAVGTANSVAGAAGGGTDLGGLAAPLLGLPCPQGADALNAALDLSGALGARAIASGVLPTALAGGSAATGIAVLSAGAGGFQLGSALRSGIRAGTGVDIGTAPADALADRLGF